MNSQAFPCKYHLTGACHRGDTCKYSHQNTPKTSTICKYFLKKTCIYGDKCSLLHQEVPLKSGSSSGGDNKEADPNLHSDKFSEREKESDSPDLGWDRNADDQRGTESDHWDDGVLDDQQSEDNRNNEKPKAQCYLFHLGGCSNGDNCGFSHSTPGSRNGARESGISNQSTPNSKVHSHKGPALVDNDIPSPSVQIPIRKKEICKHHMLGNCRMADSCRLKHPRNGKQRSLEMSARNQNGSSLRPLQPADSAIPVASEATLTSPSTSTWRDGNGRDVSDTQDTDAEPNNADEDSENKSKDPEESNHDEIDEQGKERDNYNTFETSANPIVISQGIREDTDWPGNRHDERWIEEVKSEDILPTIPQQRVTHEPIQSPTIAYPHVSEASLRVHWSQFADPLANPEIPFCKLHAQGQCVQGESCRFRHSITVEEYNILFRDQQPNLWTLSRDRSAQHALHHGVPPPSFSAFSPSADYPQPSLPQAPANLVQSTPSLFSQECKFYPLGSCRNGESCPYLHTKPPVEIQNNSRKLEQLERSIPDTPAPTQVKSGPQFCKYFGSKKGCNRGNNCIFRHEYDSGNSYPSSGPSGPQSSTDPVIEEEDKGWSNNWNEPGDNNADNNGWDEPAPTTGWDEAAASHWDQPPSTHPKDSEPKSEVGEWPPTDGSSHSVPWVVAPALCPYHVKGRCRKGTSCQLRHDPEARAPDATDGHSRLQSESPQPNLEASFEASHDQAPNTTDEDSHQRAAPWGEGELELEATADQNDEEQGYKDAEPQDSHEEELTLEPEQQSELATMAVKFPRL
jgi:hypothetical protein